MPRTRLPLGKFSPYQIRTARAISVRLIVSKTKTPPGASTRAISATVAFRSRTCFNVVAAVAGYLAEKAALIPPVERSKDLPLQTLAFEHKLIIPYQIGSETCYNWNKLAIGGEEERNNIWQCSKA